MARQKELKYRELNNDYNVTVDVFLLILGDIMFSNYAFEEATPSLSDTPSTRMEKKFLAAGPAPTFPHARCRSYGLRPLSIGPVLTAPH